MTPNLATVLDEFIAARTEQIRVALPGRVVAYDALAQRASVQPEVMDGYLDEDDQRRAEALPVVQDVPVVFPGSGPYRITFPVAVGDTVLLVFASSSIARWKAAGGGTMDPADDRRHTLDDAIAIPGLVPRAAAPAPTDALVVHADEIRLGGPDANQRVAWHSALEELRDAFRDWVVAPTDGGGALKTLLTALITDGWPRGASKVKAE